MARCFAMAKDSRYTLLKDRNKPSDVVTCYALSSEGFKEMKEEHKCGSEDCPFFKRTRMEVRHDK